MKVTKIFYNTLIIKILVFKIIHLALLLILIDHFFFFFRTWGTMKQNWCIFKGMIITLKMQPKLGRREVRICEINIFNKLSWSLDSGPSGILKFSYLWYHKQWEAKIGGYSQMVVVAVQLLSCLTSICYWGIAEKQLQKERRGWAKTETSFICGCIWWWK